MLIKDKKIDPVAIIGRAQKTDGETYSVMASTPEVDRSGDVILPGAYKSSLKAYLKKNPLILWMHQHDRPPIGKATAGEIDKKGLRIDFKFADTPAAQEIKYLFDEGFLNAVSVGLLPKAAVWDPEEIKRVLGKAGVEFDPDHLPLRVFTDAELLEVSAVTVPANANALLVRALQDKFGDRAGLTLALDERAEQDTIGDDSDGTDVEPAAPEASNSPIGAVLTEADKIRAFAGRAVAKEK